jgi:hypothetical protein
LGRRLFNDALSSPARTKRLLRKLLPGMHCNSLILSISLDIVRLALVVFTTQLQGAVSTNLKIVIMANIRTVRGLVRGNKTTDLDGRDNLYVHCVSKERLELLREGMSCVELEIMPL